MKNLESTYCQALLFYIHFRKKVHMKKFKGIVFLIMACFASPVDANLYDKDEDYANHTEVSCRFFRRAPKNPATRIILEKFQREYAFSPQVSTIKLDELCPRSRILLLRSISQTIFKRYQSEKESKILCRNRSYFKEDRRKTGSTCSKETITYSFGNAKFVVRYSPSETDPGNMLIDDLSCADLWVELNNLENVKRGQEIPSSFIEEYKQWLPCQQLHRNKVFIFFDFEIAHKLVGDEPYNNNEKIPVASALISFLELCEKNNAYHIRSLFEKPTLEDIILEDKPGVYDSDDDIEEICSEERYNGYNPFEGTPWMNEAATKNILVEYHKSKEEEAKRTLAHKTQDDIFIQYYTFFWGSYEDDDYWL